MDVTDEAARKLLEKIGEKAAEIFGTDNPEKTIGQWRHEMAELATEAMWFTAARRRSLKQ